MKDTNRLSLKEAQDLYIKSINESNEELKKLYINKVILGTLYVVNEYIEKNQFELFESSVYDINDIINSFDEVWIEKIKNGELLNVNKLSSLINKTFINEAYKKMGGIEIMTGEQFGISRYWFPKILSDYITFKNSNFDKDYVEFAKEYCEKMGWFEKDYAAIIKNIPLFERIYAYLDINKKNDFALTKTKIDSCLKLLLDMGLNSSVSEEDLSITMEEDILNEIRKKEFIDDVDAALRDERKKQVVHEIFGLDGYREKSLDELSKKYGVSKERVRQILFKSLMMLHRNKELKKYKGEGFK